MVFELEGGIWKELPMMTKEMKGTPLEEDVYQFWRDHAHSTWCWHPNKPGEYEKTFAPQGPTWVYQRNGKFLVGLRMNYSDKTNEGASNEGVGLEKFQKGDTKRMVVEIQGQNNNNTLIPEYAPAVQEFLKRSEERV